MRTQTRPTLLPTLRSDPRFIQGALAIGLAIGLLLFMLTRTWALTDGDAYWNAALRLREGLPLYPPIENQDLASTYRYAPWLAWLWLPLTLLPYGAVQTGWQAFLYVCTAVACIPAIRRGEWLLAAFCGSVLAWSAQGGNIHAALIALLALGIGTRWGPLAIGVAASLKVFPIGYAAVYLVRREWGKALAAVAIALVLWVPALTYGLEHYPVVVGTPANLWRIHPALWVGAAAGAGLLVWRLRTWRAASVFVVLGTLRFIVYDFGYLLIGDDRRVAATAPSPSPVALPGTPSTASPDGSQRIGVGALPAGAGVQPRPEV